VHSPRYADTFLQYLIMQILAWADIATFVSSLMSRCKTYILEWRSEWCDQLNCNVTPAKQWCPLFILPSFLKYIKGQEI
jgi:hypothetical protein